MATQKDVYWIASALAIEEREEVNGKIDNLLGERAKFAKPLRKMIDPSNEIHVFWKIKHWGLEVDGKCYHLSIDQNEHEPKPKPIPVDANQWYRFRKEARVETERRKIGKTEKTHTEIVDEGV